MRVVNALLTQIDRLRHYPNVLILATSNVTGAIGMAAQPAITRAIYIAQHDDTVADLAFVDRADMKVYIGLPSMEARFNMFKMCIMELVCTEAMPQRVRAPRLSCELCCSHVQVRVGLVKMPYGWQDRHSSALYEYVACAFTHAASNHSRRRPPPLQDREGGTGVQRAHHQEAAHARARSLCPGDRGRLAHVCCHSSALGTPTRQPLTCTLLQSSPPTPYPSSCTATSRRCGGRLYARSKSEHIYSRNTCLTPWSRELMVIREPCITDAAILLFTMISQVIRQTSTPLTVKFSCVARGWLLNVATRDECPCLSDSSSHNP